MSDRQTPQVPSTGTTTPHENSDLRAHVRDLRWKGDEYGQTTYNPSWPVLCIAGLVWAFIIAVIVLWAGTARANENMRVLTGDIHARPAPHHSAGGITTAAHRYFVRIRDQGPFRVEGEWFSSGTMVLILVSGPYAVPGSCLGDVSMTFHEVIPLGGGNSDANHDMTYSIAFTESLRAWYHTMRRTGQMSYFRPITLDETQLAAFGYPTCDD